jgi:site-specific recombinase XerD
VVPIGALLAARLETANRERRNPWPEVTRTALGTPWGDFGLNQAFKRAQKRAGLSGWSVYDLRHYFVTKLFRSGAPAPVVQKLAGHADLATTQRYADVDADDLRDAIARFGATAGKRANTTLPAAEVDG